MSSVWNFHVTRDRQDQGEDNEGDVGPSSEGDGDVPSVTPVSTAEVAGPVDPDNETIYVSNWSIMSNYCVKYWLLV